MTLDPAWLDAPDDPQFTVRSAVARESIAFHLATLRAEGRPGPAEATPAKKPSRRPAGNQPSLLPDQEITTDGQYDQEAASAKAKTRPVARSRR